LADKGVSCAYQNHDVTGLYGTVIGGEDFLIFDPCLDCVCDGFGAFGAAAFVVFDMDRGLPCQRGVIGFIVFEEGPLLDYTGLSAAEGFVIDVAYAKAFADFTRRLPSKGWLVANGDDAQVGEIVKNSPARLVSFGLTEGNEFRATELAVAAGQQYFRVWWKEQDLGMFTAHLIGKHNVYNALAVIAAAWQFEPDLTNLRSAVADFLGTTRRLEYRGEWHGSLIYDDYAHHPTEIKAVIAALKSMEPKRHLIAVFHPHTFTRTTVLFDDFASSFAEADEVIVLEIYASARETKSNLSSMELVQAIQKNYPDKPVRYATNLESAEADLRTNLKVGEVVLLLGAGDVFRVADRLLA